MADVQDSLLPTSLRDDFPILGQKIRDGARLVYLDNAATTQRPRQVIQSMVDMYEQDYANVHRGIHWLSDQATDRFEGARETVRALLGAESTEQVIFTTGATGAINLVARSWGDANVSAGDEILVTDMEHHANLVPWHQLSERTGCVIRSLPITDDGLLCMDQLPKLLTDKTRLVAVTAASNVLGTINPISEIIAAAHANGSLVMVDAAQCVPHAKIDVQANDADFLAFSGHKIMGPSGVGVLYGKRELLDAMPPFLGGGSMIRRVKIDSFEAADLPAKFEAGTPPILEAIALGAAIDWVSQFDAADVYKHEMAVYHAALDGLRDINSFRLIGEAENKGPVLSFNLEGAHAHDVAQILDKYGVAVRAGQHCTQPLMTSRGIHSTARASFGIYNTLDEAERLVEAVKKASLFLS